MDESYKKLIIAFGMLLLLAGVGYSLYYYWGTGKMVTTESGLQYEIIKEAPSGMKKPQAGEKVTVHYTGWLQGEDGKPGNPVFKQTTDKKKDREKTFVARVEDWGKFFEEDGKTPMECTPENIIRAMREIEGFTEATNKFFEQLDEDLAKERAESLGN